MSEPEDLVALRTRLLQNHRRFLAEHEPLPPRPVCLRPCCNCYRKPDLREQTNEYDACPYKLSTTEVDLRLFSVHIYRRKFCNIVAALHPMDAHGRQVAAMCGPCYSYLSKPIADPKPSESEVWPSFVWKTLLNESTRQRAWELLPETWRPWWAEAFADIEPRIVDRQELLGVPSRFRDLTLETEADIKALSSLSWMEDLVPRELSFVLAEVKCPAGCIEFKHKANSLPFDIVWEYCLGIDVDIYSEKTRRHCTNWFRRDFCVPESILHSPTWKATPAVCFEREKLAPVVLCCRYHSVKDKQYMVHPCRSVTQVVATEKASQFTPVTPVPRTLRKTQASTYSASFQIAKMEGCYSGLDTMFLSEDGGYPYYQSKLAWKQEVLAYNGRADLKAYINKRAQEGTISGDIASCLARDKDILYPNWDVVKSIASTGSTYVSMRDAVLLQNNLFFSRHDTVSVPSSVPGSPTRSIPFKGNWPKNIVMTHPGDCTFGCRPPSLPFFISSVQNEDGRAAWILVSMLVTVPEVWAAVTAATKKVDEWEGWLLSYTAEKCFPHMKLRMSGECPFTILSSYDLLKLVQPNLAAGYDSGAVMDKFRSPLLGQPTTKRFNSILACWDKRPSGIDADVGVVIIVRKHHTRPMTPHFILRRNDAWHANWELRYLCISSKATPGTPSNKWSGSVYARHGGPQHTSWWKQSQLIDRPTKKDPGWDVDEICTEHLRRWTACIFVKRNINGLAKLRAMVLGSCGGQSIAVCAEHSIPLVITIANEQKLCGCAPFHGEGLFRCGKIAKYACPETGCRAGMCSQHFKEIENYRETVLCYPMTEAEYSHHRTRGITIRATSEQRTNEEEAGRFTINCTQGQDDIDMYDECPEDLQNVEAANEAPEAFSFPTTNATVQAVAADFPHGSHNNHRMTNHALLNCYGSCLVRRNSKLSGTVAQRAFLQKQASRTPGDSIPLIYPEGMLFANLFFAQARDNSVVGAIPASHLHGDRVLLQNGFCTLQDTYRTRILNPALLSSSDPKYHFFAFDALANFSLRGTDSRIILRRGFAESQGTGGVCIRGKKEPIFDSEHIENRALVCKLSASTAEEMPTYFYTHSLSMKTHFGMRLLWKWLTGDDIVKYNCEEETQAEISDWKRALLDSSASYLLRVWMEVSQIWLLYITKSHEAPAGVITKYFARYEFQDSVEKDLGTDGVTSVARGNMPHIHCLLWTNDNLSDASQLMAACDRIRGFVDDLIRPDEQECAIRRGLMKDVQEIQDFKDTMARFLRHEHRRRCFILKRDRDTGKVTDQRVCKASDNWYLTRSPADHHMLRQQVKHTEEAIQVMVELGLGTRVPLFPSGGGFFRDNQCYEFVPLLDSLTAWKHVPPCRGNEGIISPVIGALVAINPNSDNCQLASGYFVCRYLSKYVVKIDQYCTFQISPPKSAPSDAYTVVPRDLLNTKITSNKIAQADILQRGHNKKRVNALGINVCQIYMWLFDYPCVYTNLKHVKFSTDVYANRAAHERKQKPIEVYMARNQGLQANALTPHMTVPAHHARLTCNGLQPWRQFTPTQVQKAFDDLYSPLVADPVTVFGFRPPELRFVMHQHLYHRWFERSPIPGSTNLPSTIQYCSDRIDASHLLERSTWISADSKIIRLRTAAIPELEKYMDQSPAWYFSRDETDAATVQQQIRAMLASLKAALAYRNTRCLPDDIPPDERPNIVQRYERLAARFLCQYDDRVLPTPWTQAIKPTQSNRFLIHLLFRFGAYIDEYSLFQAGSLRNCFIAAGLLDPRNVHASAMDLMKRYFLEELQYFPCGTPTFDKYCTAAKNTIDAFFTSDTFSSMELPSVLYCRIKVDTRDFVRAYIERKQKTLVATIVPKLCAAGFTNLPTVDALCGATLAVPLPWKPTDCGQPAPQPDQSYAEQYAVLEVIIGQVDAYISGSKVVPKGVCLVGGGGVGKTTCALLGLLYARSQGLNINATALVSERAQELGVDHLNYDYSMPRVNLDQITPSQLAERTISSLYRHPEKLEFHRIVDVELVDEMGPIPAEMWSARDMILKYIRNSTKPNGGKLDIVTFDHLQMHPIQGSHPLLSPLVTSSYMFHRLEQSVRAAASTAWQRIQAISRMSPEFLTTTIENEFVNLLLKSCSFVASDEEVDPGTLFVYGKNAPIKIHERRLYSLLDKSIAAGDRNIRISYSKDHEKNFEGHFVPATDLTTKSLDSKLREQHKLYFFKGGCYRITYNKAGSFSNGQLAFLACVPDEETIKNKRPIKVLVAPPGSSYLPSAEDTDVSLLARGWMVKTVGVAPENTIDLRHFRAKRSQQYGLQLYVGSTWHSTMGKTLAKLATKIDSSDGPRGPYTIWDPTQVVIMLSRTRLPQDTIFVTKDKEGTARLIFKVLKRGSPFRAYLSSLLRQLCIRFPHEVVPVIDRRHSIYRPQDVFLPSGQTGYVYVLISTKDSSFTYIGSCQDLLLRYDRHNEGNGANQTTPPSLRPWGLLAFVSGFEGNKEVYGPFENAWIARKLNMSHNMITIRALLDIGEDLTEEFSREHGLTLQFHHAGTIEELDRHVAVSSSSSEEDVDSQGDSGGSSGFFDDYETNHDAPDASESSGEYDNNEDLENIDDF